MLNTNNNFQIFQPIQNTMEQVIIRCNGIGYVVLTKSELGMFVDTYKGNELISTTTLQELMKPVIL